MKRRFTHLFPMPAVASFLLFLLPSVTVNAQVYKSGLIAGETWQKASSPYLINGDIFVASLTIEPGVVVKFIGNYVFEVAGPLKAVGCVSDSVKFTRDSSLTWKGVLFQNSLPGTVMKYCVIENANTSGIRIMESLPQITNSSVRKNGSANSGGGIKISNTTSAASGLLEITSCTIEANTASQSNGAGVWVNSKSGTIRFKNCHFKNNQCTVNNGYAYGGGAFTDGNVEFILCIFSNNLVRGYSGGISGVNGAGNGGAVYIQSGIVNFANTIINNNRSEGYSDFFRAGYAYGGGVHINAGQISFYNSIITTNSASGQSGTFGGGLYINAGTSQIENSTFADNFPYAIQNNTDTIDVLNSILFFNNGGGTNPQVTGKLRITYSDIQNGYTGAGNINFNPLFAGSGSYKIVSPSLCIDAGNPSSQYNDSCFPPSLGSIRNDMGAHGGPRACTWNDTTSGTIQCSPIPVTWLSFKGQLRSNDAHLTWATASEQDSKEFIVERSLNGTAFTAIGTVPAAGNSSDVRHYQYTDRNAASLNTKQLYYRLKQVDIDGTFSYSSIVSISVKPNSSETLITAFPNPFTESITLQLSEPASGSTDRVELYSSQGSLVFQKILSPADGNNVLLNNLPRLPKGIYLLSAMVNGKTSTQKLTRQ